MAWTPEQLEAIEKSGSNIIVSAGAGSGKTAVLSERVLYKIKNGVHVNELLILTFTKAAASEMKDRIRQNIESDPKYKEELNLINSSYITTFDSFALSVVKKYHYLLNISSNIAISDETIVRIEEKKIIDNIFEELYLKNDENFQNLINSYCVKNDKYLRNSILKIANKIYSDINREDYFKFIENELFSDSYLNKIMNEYIELLNYKRKNIKYELDNLSYYFDSDKMEKFNDVLNTLLNCNIEELYLISDVEFPKISRYLSEEAKKAKERLKNAVDDLLSYSEFGSIEEIKQNINDNRNIVLTIVSIVKEYINRLIEYKKDNTIYTFNDIAELAIKVLEDNKEAREELKSSFKEIMIDEYQDTNDIQDKFIKLIENNNVYMVGDIKQSIYKFRGSNPNIFKEKYDNYSLNNGGYKIDLLKNFRSRSEVLDNINKIFELIMDNEIGGAEYKKSHEMIPGNDDYKTERINDYDYNMNIFEYENDKNSGYKNYEVEIFAIVNDIKNKINSNMKVYDKKTKKLRNIRYSDFVIILDRSKYFGDYKKIFEYSGIPLTILKEEKLNSSTDILLIRNIFDFILRIRNEDYGLDYKYDFISIARSFLYEYKDNQIFEIIKNNKIKETNIYKDFSSINSINSKTSTEVFEEILEITKFYEKISKVGDYEDTRVRITSLENISNSLNNIGYDIEDFINYLDDINENDIEIKYESYSSNNDSVKIMTIHKSKGLEYPICYFSDLDHEYNMSDSNDMFVTSDKYGLIVPNTVEESTYTILKRLFRNDYIKEEISEKIRLFYVALTRAREQVIIFIPKKDTSKLYKDDNGVINKSDRLSFLKLSEFIYGVKDYLNEYFYDLDINKIGLTKNYLFKKSLNSITNKNNIDFIVNEINIENDITEEEHFSKESYSIIDNNTYKNMKYGTGIHEYLEYIDFKNYNENLIDDKFIRDKINKFMNNDIIKNAKDSNVYHEYEFTYNKDNTLYHGIIDLMLEYSDHIDIIDYKLKSVNDENYLNQLNGYREYISSISNKKVNIYLYSILDETIKSI